MIPPSNARLAAIGILVASADPEPVPTAEEADIERTLLDGVESVPGDPRLLSLLLSWIGIHGECVIVEKLRKLASYREKERPGSTAWLPALAAFAVSEGYRRWKPLVRRSKETLYLVPKEVTESAVSLKGSVPWLEEINVRVPNGTLRIRPEDVLPPRQLVSINPQYRNRFLFGPSWRADVATAVDRGLRSPTQISRSLGCSYEPAHRMYRQIALARNLE